MLLLLLLLLLIIMIIIVIIIIDKYLDFARELKKLWNMQVIIIPVVIGAFGIVTKGTGGLGSWRTSGNHPNDSIIEIG